MGEEPRSLLGQKVEKLWEMGKASFQHLRAAPWHGHEGEGAALRGRWTGTGDGG